MGRRNAGLVGRADLASIAAAALLATSCFHPAAPADCTVSCAGDGTCPAGLTCTGEGVCASAADACHGGTTTGVDPALIGDVVTYTFDGPLVDHSVWDRSGRLISANLSGTPSAAAGRYGNAVAFGAQAGRALEASVALAELEELTFEAWIAHTGGQRSVLFGDRRAGQDPSYELSIESDGTLRLQRGPCGNADAAAVATSSFEVPVSPMAEPLWVYVALTWDGENARFYLGDGETLEEETHPLEARGCDADRAPFVMFGKDDAGTDRLVGFLDELKLSSWVKTTADLEASLAYDSTALVGVCGDGHREAGEECEGPSACCEPSSCQLLEATPCGDGGICKQGVCVAEASVPEPLIHYDFDDGAGTTVRDLGPAGLDLSFEETEGVTWVAEPSALDVAADVEIVSGPIPVEEEGVPELRELTIEALVQAATRDQEGPARIVGLSVDAAMRDFLVGQEAGDLTVRFTTSLSTNQNGVPSLVATGAFDTRAQGLRHIVFTHAEDGEERLYVDGVLHARGRRPGDLEWPTQPEALLRLAHEGDSPDSRHWHGRYARIRIFDRALSDEQIGTLHGEAP